ncbi:expressed protein [Phakopsora pachyrhizi]|uniref:Expressed protein n=1 Tax=Phakopsora pachyrhizi TaxID=170000 RepID=A0AAV0AMC1_PHAPC|nr:expressed protein [Phakopsora pachyrhizi]
MRIKLWGRNKLREIRHLLIVPTNNKLKIAVFQIIYSGMQLLDFRGPFSIRYLTHSTLSSNSNNKLQLKLPRTLIRQYPLLINAQTFSKFKNSSNNLNSGSYESFCKNVLDPISVSNPFKVQIDAIADEVQKMNQAASKIALAVMSKMDGKPDDVHDEEYHTMIEGMLSDKEFRKTLPAGLVEQYYDLTRGYSRPNRFGPAPSSFSESDNLNLFNGNLITILMDATKKATDATAAILGNHNKTTNPGTFLNSLNSSNGSTSQFLSRPSESQRSKEGSMRIARDISLGNRNIDDTRAGLFNSAVNRNSSLSNSQNGPDRLAEFNPFRHAMSRIQRERELSTDICDAMSKSREPTILQGTSNLINNNNNIGNTDNDYVSNNNIISSNRSNRTHSIRVIADEYDDGDRSSCGAVRSPRFLKSNRSNPYPLSNRSNSGLNSRRSSNHSIVDRGNPIHRTTTYNNLLSSSIRQGVDNYCAAAAGSNGNNGLNSSFENSNQEPQRTTDNGFSIHSASTGLMNDAQPYREADVNHTVQSIKNHLFERNFNSSSMTRLIASNSNENNNINNNYRGYNEEEERSTAEEIFKSKSDLERLLKQAEEVRRPASYQMFCIQQANEILSKVEAMNGADNAKAISEGFFILSCYKMTCEISSDYIRRGYTRGSIE